MSALVSIVMPCYKAGAFIGKALESIAQQKFQNWELIAVDDAGPDDGAKDQVLHFAALFPDNRVEWIRHEKNRGVSAARNSGIGSARGKYIALLDPDDFWMPEHLERALEILEFQPDISMFTSQAFLFLNVSPEASIGIEGYEGWEVSAFPWILGLRNALPASSSVLRRCVFDEVGSFDEDPGIQHHEDYDMWLRMAEAGNRFFLLSEPTVYYRKHASAATSDPSLMSRAKIALSTKHMKYLFILQREALERLCWTLRNNAVIERNNSLALSNCESRIRLLEGAREKVMGIPGVRTLSMLRRWYMGK